MYNRYRRKFTSKQIEEMRGLVEDGYGIHFVARKLGCRANAVWHHVFDLIPPKKLTKKEQDRNLRGSNLTITKVKRIRELGVGEGFSAKEIARKFNISSTSALSIIKGKTFRWIPGKTLSGVIVPIEYKYEPKTDLTRGPKKGSKKKVKTGVLEKYAKTHGVDTTTICRWIQKGKLKLKKSELINPKT